MFPKKHELLKLDFLSSPGKPTGCERFSGLSSRNSTKLSVMNIHSGETTTDSKSRPISFSLPYFIKIMKKNENFLGWKFYSIEHHAYLIDFQIVIINLQKKLVFIFFQKIIKNLSLKKSMHDILSLITFYLSLQSICFRFFLPLQTF